MCYKYQIIILSYDLANMSLYCSNLIVNPVVWT